MPKNVIRIGCAVVGLALAVPTAPLAQADDHAFVAAAHALGFQQWDEPLIRLGRHACYFLGAPAGVWPNLTRRDADDVTKYIARYGAVEWDPARQFLNLSVNEYCPQYRELVGA